MLRMGHRCLRYQAQSRKEYKIRLLRMDLVQTHNIAQMRPLRKTPHLRDTLRCQPYHSTSNINSTAPATTAARSRRYLRLTLRTCKATDIRMEHL
jgi:hypothetical protein